jgi:prepilin-type N-terminal cleavage/methylation domain-containing protein
MNTSLRHRLADDAGFSLIELLTALAIGSVVLTASLMFFLNGLSGTAKVTDRVEASQRGRLVTDQVSTLVQAAVCDNVGSNAPITVAQPSSMTFTAQLGTGTSPGNTVAYPKQYRVRWDSTTNSVYEDIWTAGATGTYAASPSTTILLGANMRPADGTNLFTYYAFDQATGTIASAPLGNTVTGDDNLVSIVAVGIKLLTLPEHTKSSSDLRSTEIDTQAILGSVDPSNTSQVTQC